LKNAQGTFRNKKTIMQNKQSLLSFQRAIENIRGLQRRFHLLEFFIVNL